MEQPANGSLDGGQGSTLQTRSTPGAMLRAARESRGLSREQLCEAIQLERRLLDALEEDRFEAFDAPVFARGFLRKSATHLGLDPVVVLEGYDRLHRGPEAPSHIPPTTRITPRRVSPWRLPLLGVAALLLVGGVIWWIVVMLGGLGATPSTATPTEESLLAGNDSTAFTPAAAENAAMVPAGETGVATAPESTPDGAAVVEGSMPAEAGADLAAPGTVAPGPAAAPSAPAASPTAPAARGTLQFQFSGSSWLNVVGPDGRRLYVGMAPPGVLPFNGPGPWQVLVGDVRQVRVAFAGRELVLPKPAADDNVVRFTVTADGQVR